LNASKNDNEQISVKKIKEFYNTIEKPWPDDFFNSYTHNFITSYILKNLSGIDSSSIVLNAGSGGSTYDIPGVMYHLDIALNRIAHLPKHCVGSIEKIPFNDNFFDAIICVGTVINYTPKPEVAISELSRVLKPNGLLILEYERSGSGVITKEHRNQDKFLYKHTYFGKSHENYLYSDKFVKGLLKKNNLAIKNFTNFHAAIPFIDYFFSHTDEADFMEKYVPWDKFMHVCPIIKNYSHNAILKCTKTIEKRDN